MITRAVRRLLAVLLRVVVPGIRRVVPADRVVAPGIVLLVVAANVVGAGVVTLLLLGVNGGSDADSPTGRLVTAVAGAGYLVLAIPVGVLWGCASSGRPTGGCGPGGHRPPRRRWSPSGCPPTSAGWWP
ncbi:hypothetical protein ACFQX8_00410 [Klenkia terrae]|uniref:hypothetical protein n=1 Tax=Klenkia terrae TaxID=1052259 RepID=UPI0036184BAC